MFIAPALLLILLVMAYPLLQGIWMSLTATNDYTGVTRFVGFEQYTTLFASEDFQRALRQSFVLVGATVVFGIIVATGVALVLHHVPWGGRLWRTIVLIPWLISGVAVATIWRALFSPRGGGVPDMIIDALGLDPITWLASPFWATVVIVMITIWSASPFATLIIYSGLKTIDPDLYEAAELDGAGPVARFVHVTIPSIAPQFSLALIWMSFGAFNSFDIVLLATGGGPGRSTEVLAVLLYRLGFQNLDFHASAAVMVVLLAINFLMSILYMKLLPKRD
jgi:ABC-type sugar transport system permease subunit